MFAALLPLTHWAIARHSAPGEPWRPSRHAAEYLSLSVCLGLYLAVRFWLLPASEHYGVRISDSLAYAMATGLVAVGYYLLLLIHPHPLCADYRGVVAYVTTFADWRVWTSAAAIVALTAFAWSRRKRQPLAFWGWAWFLISIVPVLEHRSHSGVHGRAVPVSAIRGTRCVRRDLARFGTRAAIARRHDRASLSFFCVFSGLTWMRQRAWSSNEVLWRTTLDDFPSAQGAFHGYGSALIEAGRYMEAITYLRHVLDDPGIGRDRRAAVARELGFAHISLGQVATRSPDSRNRWPRRRPAWRIRISAWFCFASIG